MKKTTITILTKTKKRAQEVVSELTRLIQSGETIDFEIVDVEPEEKQVDSGDDSPCLKTGASRSH